MKSSENKTCFILNYAPHYRKAIFEKLSKELDCDIYCGDKIKVYIKKIEFDTIDFTIQELKTIWFLNNFAWIKGQIRLLFNNKYSTYVLTGQPFFLSDSIFVLLCFFTKKKVFIWNHAPNDKKKGFMKLYYKLFFSLIDGAFIYSNRGKDMLMKNYGINGERLHVIYNSLDYDYHLSIRANLIDKKYYENKAYFTNPSLPILLFIGRLTVVKRIDLLIEVVRELNSNNFQVNLIIIGDGIIKKDLMDKAEDLKDFIYFYGDSYDEFENAKLIANADLCVSPGNVGLTAIHSLSFGTPVCTHDNLSNQGPEVEAIEVFKTGVYYNQDKNNLATIIEEWFKCNLDRNEIRENCFDKIDHFYNPNFQIKVFKEIFAKH